MFIPSLLPELWLEVFDYLPQRDLATICAIARGWHQLATPILYQNIYLSGSKYPDKSSVAIAKIKLSPRVHARSVKTCHLSHWKLGPETSLDPDYASLLELLPLLPNLHTLHCARVFIGDALCQYISQHQALRTLRFDACNISCSIPLSPPPKLATLMIGNFWRQKDCAPLVSFSLAPTLRTLSIWPTEYMFSKSEEWKKESSPTMLTDLQVDITRSTQQSGEAAVRHLISRSPLLKRLVLHPYSDHFEIPPGTALQLESYVGDFLSLLNIVPDRPIRDVSFTFLDDRNPQSLYLAFTSILRSTVPLRQLKIVITAIHMNQKILYQISSLFPSLQCLTLETTNDSPRESRSILQLLDDEMRRKLCTLLGLRSLCLPCFNSPSPSMLALEMNFINEFKEAMRDLVEVSFSKLGRWEWTEGRWVSHVRV